MKKTLLAGVGTMALVASSFAFAGPAQASQANCDAKAATYITAATSLESATYVDSPQRRCTIITNTVAAPVPSGSIDWQDPETRILDTYLSEPGFEFGELVGSSQHVEEGDWVKVGEDQVTTTSGGTGKSKNVKNVTTTVSTFERTVITTVTEEYEVFSVIYELTDVEQYREGSEATTVTTTRTTRVFNVNSSGTLVGDPSVTSTPTTADGDPIDRTEDPIEGSQETLQSEEPESSESVEATEENGGLVVLEPTVTTESDTVTVVETCVQNKNKSKNRGNCEQ